MGGSMMLKEKYPAFSKTLENANLRWRLKNFNYDEMLLSCNQIELVAVLIASLNYQVTNGGFDQWIANKYSRKLKELLQCLDLVGTETSKKVKNLLLVLTDTITHYSGQSKQLDRLYEGDKAYYAINCQLLDDVEKYIAENTAQPPAETEEDELKLLDSVLQLLHGIPCNFSMCVGWESREDNDCRLCEVCQATQKIERIINILKQKQHNQ